MGNALLGVETMSKSVHMSVRFTSSGNQIAPVSALLFAVAAVWSGPGLLMAQVERPALVQSYQGSGNTKSSDATGALGELSIEPIGAGQTVHVNVFGAPDFSITARVSDTGEIPYPMLGTARVGGLNSADAAKMLAERLQSLNLIVDPHVIVTVDSNANEITILGEVRTPGVYPTPGKHMLSDLIALAGGLTANTGRVIEISNQKKPGQSESIPWDPTLRDVTNFDRLVYPGDRIVVRPCGIAYVGGHVLKPGAYSLCGSRQLTVSEVIAIAGGIAPLTSYKHTYLVRAQPDGTRAVSQMDVQKILQAKVADPEIREDDILYVSPSAMKDVLQRVTGFALSLVGPLMYTYGR
jgi:polysaccharide biosynthesis/export protein